MVIRIGGIATCFEMEYSTLDLKTWLVLSIKNQNIIWINKVNL